MTSTSPPAVAFAETVTNAPSIFSVAPSHVPFTIMLPKACSEAPAAGTLIMPVYIWYVDSLSVESSASVLGFNVTVFEPRVAVTVEPS